MRERRHWRAICGWMRQGCHFETLRGSDRDLATFSFQRKLYVELFICNVFMCTSCRILAQIVETVCGGFYTRIHWKSNFIMIIPSLSSLTASEFIVRTISSADRDAVLHTTQSKAYLILAFKNSFCCPKPCQTNSDAVWVGSWRCGCLCSGSAGASVVAHSVALPLYRDCFLDLRLFNSPDLRRLVLCYCCQAWTLETVLGGNTALTRWWTARSIDADAKR